MPCCGGLIGSCAQAEGRHVGIDVFVVTVLDDVGFVPDSDGSAGADGLVELLPRRKVGGVAGLCIFDELLGRLPVLDRDDVSAKPGFVPKET